jgi:hypothetical protein
MNAQRRRSQQQPRRSGETSAPAKYPCRSKAESARPPAIGPRPAAGPHSARAPESSSPAPAAAGADPRRPSARSPPAARCGPASAGPACRGRRLRAPAPACTANPLAVPAATPQSRAQFRLQPALRLHAEERIGVRSIRPPARNSRVSSSRHIASFSSVSGVSLAPAPKVTSSSRAKLSGRKPMPHPRKLQAMQMQPHLAGRACPHLHPLPRASAEPAPSAAQCPPWQRSTPPHRRKRMHQPRIQIARVAKVHLPPALRCARPA